MRSEKQNKAKAVQLPYDESDPHSIELYAKKLIDHRLRDKLKKDIVKKLLASVDKKNKGQFGNLVQEYYFLKKPNSRPEPDFLKAGVELKVIPLKKNANKTITPKERLVLNIIDFEKIIDETWETSSFLKKNKFLLLMFYLYIEKDLPLDYIFKIIRLWEYPKNDLKMIRKDWETIVNKIKAKKAHELSEGDTFYLGACTKGATSKTLRLQTGTTIKAKQRAFSFKQNYLREIIRITQGGKSGDAGSLLKVAEQEAHYSKTFDDIATERFQPYIGKTLDEIKKMLNVEINVESKGRYAQIARAIMGVKTIKIEEFEKADIQMKTMRLSKDGTPEEDISFPYFEYMEIVKEKWEESTLREMFSKKYFFVIFKENEKNEYVLFKAMFWNIPYDVLEGTVKSCWLETVRKIKAGKAEDLPKKSFNNICHVRPHGANKKDKIDTPQGERMVKKGFWLDRSFIKQQVV